MATGQNRRAPPVSRQRRPSLVGDLVPTIARPETFPSRLVVILEDLWPLPHGALGADGSRDASESHLW
jgi:hypothetical protein